MQPEQRQRAFTAFQEFLNTALEERLQQPQHPSSETVEIALFQNVAATVPAYQNFLAEHNINPASIQTFRHLPKRNC
jgi:phenylacetate-CoA ligase